MLDFKQHPEVLMLIRLGSALLLVVAIVIVVRLI